MLRQLQKLAPELHRVSNLHICFTYLVMCVVLHLKLCCFSFSFSFFFILMQVHFLRYLNGLYHDDYFAALENLHCYFDYRYVRTLAP